MTAPGGIFAAAAAFQPPYVPTTLSPPLTAAQRAAMISWMSLQTKANNGTFDAAGANAASDPDLITAYTTIYDFYKFKTAPITGPVAAVEGSISNPFGPLLSALTNSNTWIRVAEFVVGGILLAIGLSHALGVNGAIKNAGKAAIL